MTRSKQRRSQLARRIAAGLDRPPPSSGAAASRDSGIGDAGWRGFAYRLPAWIALACFVAIPVAILIVLLSR